MTPAKTAAASTGKVGELFEGRTGNRDCWAAGQLPFPRKRRRSECLSGQNPSAWQRKSKHAPRWAGLTMYVDGLSPCRVNLTYWPAAWTSSSSRPLDAQPNPAGSVSVTAPNPPQPAAVMVNAPPGRTVLGICPFGGGIRRRNKRDLPCRYCGPGVPRMGRRGRGL